MTYKIAMEVSATQLEALVEQLPISDKIRLVRKLERQTWGKRLNNLFKEVAANRRKNKISSKEIWNEVKQARQKFYGRRPRQ